jgi:lipid-A-disaccharide synthase-like uncharacterized protein
MSQQVPVGNEDSSLKGSVLPLGAAFAAGALFAALLGWGAQQPARAASPSAPAGVGASSVAAPPRPWLPTRTFDCPECGGAVPTNDNALPVLLLGFAGQGAFGLRFLLQWIASERARASVIPEAFWWLSIAGGLLLLLYGWALLAWPIIIGQGLNCLIYGRNLVFIRAAQQPAVRTNTMNDRDLSSSDRPLSNDELLGWIEFACWTMLALWPLLYWANGPAVSTDQLVMRTALLAVAALGALALCIRRWRRKRSMPEPRGAASPGLPERET